ncbi:amidohydrolase [Herbiconiux sp. P17]|uniref:amidohydrolase n=1 Tax=Herbiconiux wuyangfengii TaxID=3342794 RepID=UPI0035B90868
MHTSIDREKLNSLLPDLTALRRNLHAHPELSGNEKRTAALVASELRSYGVEVVEGVGGLGVVGSLVGDLKGERTIGIRADMDALPIDEQTGLEYRSTKVGVMHACGHDGHVASLLGAARYLSENRDFAGTARFIFQPAEETNGGARAMVEDGLFDRFPCEAVYAFHAAPATPTGVIGTRSGPLMAGVGEFVVVFTGSGGHGGLAPHLTQDLTLVQANFIIGLNTIVSRNIAPGEAAVVSVGYVNTGDSDTGATNVLPARVEVGGSLRYFAESTRDVLERRVNELANAAAHAFGAAAEVEVTWTSAPVINPANQVEIVARAARAAVGGDFVFADVEPVFAAEDFADMLEVAPGALVFIGNGFGSDGSGPMIHTPRFDFNDDVLPHAVALWVTLVHQELQPS